MYESGKSQRNIGGKYRCSHGVIAKVLRRYNVEMRDTSITSRKYHLNHRYFETIDTEEKAYWLGFIYADGYITSSAKHGDEYVGIALASRDIEHLEKFKKAIDATYLIHTYEEKGNFGNPDAVHSVSRILMSSQAMVDDLKDKGLPETKIKITCLPNESQVPRELLKHFVRGYFDGDGSINLRYNKHGSISCGIGICSNKNILRDIEKWSGFSWTWSDRYPERDNGNAQISSGRVEEIYHLLSKLYLGASVSLDRKKELALEYIENRNIYGLGKTSTN